MSLLWRVCASSPPQTTAKGEKQIQRCIALAVFVTATEAFEAALVPRRRGFGRGNHAFFSLSSSPHWTRVSFRAPRATQELDEADHALAAEACDSAQRSVERTCVAFLK